MAERQLIDSQAQCIQDGPPLYAQQNIINQYDIPLWMKIFIVLALLFSFAAFISTMYILFVGLPNASSSTTNKTIIASLPNVGDYKLSVLTSDHADSTGNGTWLLCDGTLIDKTIYPKLFNVIEYTFGHNNQKPNLFALPNPTGKVIGISDNEYVLGMSIGSEIISHTLITANIPTHHHLMMNSVGAQNECSMNNNGANNYICSNGATYAGDSQLPNVFSTSSVGSGAAVNISTLQPTAFIANVFIYSL